MFCTVFKKESNKFTSFTIAHSILINPLPFLLAIASGSLPFGFIFVFRSHRREVIKPFAATKIFYQSKIIKQVIFLIKQYKLCIKVRLKYFAIKLYHYGIMMDKFNPNM